MDGFDAVFHEVDHAAPPFWSWGVGLCEVAADRLDVAVALGRAAQELDLDLHAPARGGLGLVGEKVLLTGQGLGGDVLPCGLGVVAVVADPDLKGAAGREAALNVDEGLGRHIVGRHRHGLLELDRVHGLVEGQGAHGALVLGVGGGDGQGVVAVQQLEPLVGRDLELVGVAEGGRVGAQRGGVQFLHDRDLMAVGVGDGVLVGGRRGGEAAEVGVAAADDGRPVIGDGAHGAGGVGALGPGRVVCLDAILHARPSVGDGVGVAPGAAAVNLCPCAVVHLALQLVAGKVAVGIGRLSPRDAQVFAADDLARDSDGAGGRGRLVVDDCVAAVRVGGVGDQEIRGQITSGAQAEVAEEGVAPGQRAIVPDEAGVEGRPGIGVPQPVVPRLIGVDIVVGVGSGRGRDGSDAAGVVAEYRQLAAAHMVAREVDLGAGQGENLVHTGLRPAAVRGALADGDGGGEQGGPLVGREAVEEAGDGVVWVVAAPDVGRVGSLIRRVLRGVPLARALVAVEPLAQVGVDVAVIAVVSAVAVAVGRLHRVEAQQLDDLVGHEGDAVGGVAGVVFVGLDPDDRRAVEAAELDFCLVGKASEGLRHESCLLSVGFSSGKYAKK